MSLPNKLFTLGSPAAIPAVPADTGRQEWSLAAPSGGEGEEEVGRSPRSGAALEGVFVSCFLGSSRKEILSHSAVLKCDELCSSPIPDLEGALGVVGPPAEL